MFFRIYESQWAYDFKVRCFFGLFFALFCFAANVCVYKFVYVAHVCVLSFIWQDSLHCHLEILDLDLTFLPLFYPLTISVLLT